MINNIWFYFLLTPIVVSVLTLNSLFFNKGLSKPVFENALEYCVDEDNNFVYSDQGTAQDICIDEYMNAPLALELVIKIFLLFGFLFIVPLILYLKSTNS